MKKIFLLKSSRWLVIFHDLIMINLTWILAFWLRFDSYKLEILLQALTTLPVPFLTQAFSFWLMGLYRGIWRFASIPDLSRIIKAIGLGSILGTFILFLINRLANTPRSVIIIHSLLLLVALGGSRFLVRKIKEIRNNLGKKVLIIGANQYGESLARELLREARSKINPEIPVAFVDRDLTKRGQEIYGLRVAGNYQDLLKVIKKYKIELLAITEPRLTIADKKAIIAIAEQLKLPVKILPIATHVLASNINLDSLREISIEDLLSREANNIHWQDLKQAVVGKTIMITGAGGSIGSELCRQVIALEPKLLILVDNSEFNLFAITEEIQRITQTKMVNIVFKKYLIDLCDSSAVSYIMQQDPIQIIFHAAAFKHVPMLEDQVREAVKNNILGTMLIAKSALEYAVESFVLVSTDKAVNPVNIMGMTKRVAEMICQSYNNLAGTKFISVRFGNVLGSVGSVVQIFNQQLANGGPLTVTHPEMERFFMTIPEACQLILQALTLGQGGETFVLDMGEPIKIIDLAKKMIRLSGKIPDQEIKISYTGLRPGEKLQEKLFYNDEKLSKTRHTQIHLALPYKLDREWLTAILNKLELACAAYDQALLREILQEIVHFSVIYDDHARLICDA